MPDSILRCKSKDFAKQIVFLCRDVKSKYKESVLTNQLLRSGTSIGANIHEAQYAQGKKDFISAATISRTRVHCQPSENNVGKIKRRGLTLVFYGF